MVATWNLAIDWNRLVKVCCSCLNSYCGKSTQLLGPLCLWQCLKMKRKSWEIQVIPTDMKMQRELSWFWICERESEVELSSGGGGGGNLEGVGNNEANQLSRGEIFLTFFCIPLHASFQGGIFLLSFLHSKRQILRTSPKIFVLFLIDFAMLIVKRPKKLRTGSGDII